MSITVAGDAATGERRYVALAQLARSAAAAADFRQLATAVSACLGEPLFDGDAPAVRLWAITPEGFEELAREPVDGACAPPSQRTLQRAARHPEPEVDAGRLLVGLHSLGMTLGVLEVHGTGIDEELVAHAAAIVACSAGLLAGQDAGDVLPAPVSLEGASDTASLMAAFATEAKRMLDHDRLSAYLLTADARAFERFAVATSSIVPGEGVVIPFEDVGLRHVVVTNRALVSADLASDPRIVGREDRVIARAGFHGLISVPLRRGGRPFGVLNFVSRTPAFYGEGDVPIAEQIADQVAAFIGNLHAQERMRTLIRHEAAEAERARVARELYHVVAQTVPAIDAYAEDLERRLNGVDDEGGAEARRMRELLWTELADVRRAVADLVPRALDRRRLDEAIEATFAGFGAHDPEPALSVEGSPERLSKAARRTAYRIFQEAVTNARLHAGARALRVALCIDADDLHLTIDDDGVGFDPDAQRPPGGTGLGFMHERARALGGMLSVESAIGRGTTVRFCLLGAADRAAEPAPRADELGADGAGTLRLRVFVVDPDTIARAGVAALLNARDETRVVGEASSGEAALRQIGRLHPDVVIVSAQLAESELERTIAGISTALPRCGTLVLGGDALGRDAALEELGPSVVSRSAAGAELADAVRAVASGQTVGPSGDHRGCGLSPRERAVLTLVTAGHTNAEIGATLYLATKTVERQVATIIGKLGARNRAHAGAIAVARHLVGTGELEG